MASSGERPWRVRYDGPCARCGTFLRRGTPALWDTAAHKISCIECPAEARVPEVAPIDLGVTGHSARATYDRLKARREAGLDARFGTGLVRRIVGAMTVEPQSITAWGIGARGEELLGEALDAVPGLCVLHDRRVRDTEGNIDHIVVAAAGVFVVDTKHYKGLIEVRDRGPFWRSDLRLTVNRRDQSKLARNMGWQVDAVRAALEAAGVDPLPPITPVLCFFEGEWPLFGAPDEFEGVRLEDPKSLRKRLDQPAVLASESIDRFVRILSGALPSK